MSKPIISASVSEKTKDKVDEFADSEGISRSEAVQRLLDQGLDVQQSDVTVIKGTEGEAIPDGGTVREIKTSVDQVEQQVTDINEQVAEVRETESEDSLITTFLVLGIIWIIAFAVFDPSTLWTVVSGLIVALGITAAMKIQWGNRDE